MVTEKQLAANRANAKKSTGPRTPEGRRRTSQNALKHGALAKAILVEGECRERFLHLCEAYEREYNPQTPTEQALVNKAVTAQWRALRAASLESAAITHEIQRQSEITTNENDATRAMLAVRALNESSPYMERLSLYEHRFDLQHRHAIRDLHRLRQKHSEAQEPEIVAPENGVTHPSSDSAATTCGCHSQPQGPTKAAPAAIICAHPEKRGAGKINLNKPTHFNEATKGLTVQSRPAKPIHKPLKAA